MEPIELIFNTPNLFSFFYILSILLFFDYKYRCHTILFLYNQDEISKSWHGKVTF